MKWILGILVGLAAMLGFVVLVGTMAPGDKTTSPEEVAEILDKLADAANEMIGQEAGPKVVIAGAWVNGGKYLIYGYTIPGANIHVDEKIAAEKSAEIIRAACRDRKMSKAFRGGAQITYSYRTESGRELLAIRVNQEVCDS